MYHLSFLIFKVPNKISKKSGALSRSNPLNNNRLCRIEPIKIVSLKVMLLFDLKRIFNRLMQPIKYKLFKI